MRYLPKLVCVFLCGLSVIVAAGCRPPSDDPPKGIVEQEVWSNGDFEADPIGTAPPTGWTTSANLNPAITDLRPNPQTLASLNLQAGGTLITHVVGGAPESQADPDMGTAASLRFPKYGQRAVRVNSTGAGSGTGRNVNSLRQTMTVSLGDVDTVDNKVHVRFAVAPVLQNPGHGYTEQPYYFVRLQNLTKNQIIYQDFNASGQPGVPWKLAAGGAIQYTDWQLVDVSPGNSLLAVGDQVELVVTAAGCSQSGHWGHVYVDGVGSGVPGLYTWATGPQAANAGSTITYTVNYKNGGTTTANGSAIDFVTPPNTTFQSVSLGAACTTPAVGGTGTITCPLGNLANGSTGSFQVTVTIPPATPNGTVILAGNYSIYATGISALLGPKVSTTVTSSVSYADVGVSISDGVAALGWGQATTYQIDVTNAGPVAASSVTIADTMPAQLTGVTWTCSATGGGACTAAGSGDINDNASLPVGATLRYLVNATVVAGSGSSQVVHTVTATVGGGVSDPDSTNNTALDTNAIGTLRTLTFTKSGDLAGGSVISVPASISCGPGCGSGSGQFLDGSDVVLTAAPISGALFAGWGGACSGTSTTCSVTMAGDQAVTATFVGAPTSVTVSGGGTQTATVNTAFAQPLAVLVTDSNGTPRAGVTVTFAAPGSGASASLSSTTVVTDALGIASVTATANATAGSYSVTATVSGLTPASFTLTNRGLPATIAATGGGAQSTVVTTAFAQALAVRVEDAVGNPVPGVTVTFAAPGSGATASLSSTTAVTDGSGAASVTATASAVAGSYSVTATVSGLLPASFSLTNTPGAPATIAATGGGTQSAVVTTAFAQALAVRVEDAHGNAVPGVTVTFAAPGSGATASLSSTTAVTDGSGAASVTATASAVAGSYSVTATVSGLLPASFSLTNTPGSPATIAATGGGAQSAVVTTAFAQALAVRVEDAHGNAVPGVTVTFAAPGSGATASLSSTTAVTDGSGAASVSATASAVAGSYSVTATVSGLLPASFSLTNTPGAPATVAVTGGGTQSAVVTTAFAQALAVRVEDAHGNAVPGVTVTFAAPGSGATASLSSTTAVTDGSGAASVTATASAVAGSYSVTATVSGLLPASFSLTNTPGAPATVSITGGGTQSAVVTTAFAQALAVRVEDAHGNAVPGVTVTFAAPGSGATASLSLTTAVTSGSGAASVTATASAVAGNYSVTATVSGLLPASFSLTNTPGAPATIAATGGGAQSAVVTTAFAQALAVRVEDAHGNAVPGATVTFAAPGSGATASLSSTTAVTDGSGAASVTATASAVAGNYSVTATVSGVTPASFSLTNTPGAPATIAATGGGAQSAVVTTAFAQALAVRVEDAHGNVVPGVTVTFAAPGSGATASLSSTTAVTNGSGAASVTATANATAGSYSVTATVSGLTPASFSLTNTPGAPATIAVVSGGDQRAAIETAFAQPLVVQVLDAHGNPVPGAAVSFTAPGTGATATVSASVTTDAQGRASTAATAGSIAGSYLVSASVTGVLTPATFSLTNDAGGVATLSIVSGHPQSAVVTTAYAAPLVVVVRDHASNPVPGATVTFAAPLGSPTVTLSATSVVTDSNGRAQVVATADTRSGSFQVTAQASAGAPVAFDLTNLAGAPATISALVGGTPQSATVLTGFEQPLAVLVQDAFGNPVPGATVTYTEPGVGASIVLSEITAQTDASGVAQVTGTANGTAGAYLVSAHVAGVLDAAAFALTNLAGAPATVAALGGDEQATEVDTDFAEALEVQVLDAQGNPVPGAVVTFSAATGAVTATLSASTVATDSEGRAQVGAHASTTAGSHQVTAVVVGASSPAVFSLENLPGAPASLVVSPTSSPQQAQVTTAYPQPLALIVLDRFGNPVPQVAITFTAPTSGPSGALDAGTATSDAQGLAAVTITANQLAGAFDVLATVDGVTLPAVFALTNLHGAAHTVSIDGGNMQETIVDTAFAAPLVVRVTDSFGNPVIGEPVTFTAPIAGATSVLATASGTTDSSGRFATTAVAGTVTGAYQVEAVAAGGGSPVEFTLTNLAGAPASISVVGGGGAQSAQVLHPFAQALAVIVRDAFGNPVPGATVRFVASALPGATLSAPDSVTDGEGQASVLAIADRMTGNYQVVATVGALVATFSLTNTASAPGAVVVARGGGQRALATVAYAEPVVFQVLDAYGNPVSGVELLIELPVHGPGAEVVRVSAQSDAAGEVSLELLAKGMVGTFSVSASAPGASSAAMATLTVAPIPTTVTATAPASVPVDRRAPLAISVTGQLGVPTGEVQIYDELGQLVATVALTRGLAEVEVDLSARGQRRFVVRYPAQGSYDGSDSAEVVVTASDDAGTLSGSGCQSGAGGGGWLLVGWLLLWAARLRDRRSGLSLGIVLGVLGAAGVARAQSETRAVNRYHAPAADSEWLAADSLSYGDTFGVALAQTWDYARRPLVVYEDDGTIRSVPVENSLVVHTSAAVALGRGLRVAVAVPMAVYQNGDDAVFNGEMLPGPKYAFGDLQLAADLRLRGQPGAPLRAAVGLRLATPTGSRSHFMSDSRWGVEPRAFVASTRGPLELGAELSMLLRRRTELAGQSHGSELRFIGSAGVRVAQRRVLVGAELVGATSLVSDTATGTPIELGVSARTTLAHHVVLGLGGTLGLVQAVGTPDYRWILSASWTP